MAAAAQLRSHLFCLCRRFVKRVFVAPPIEEVSSGSVCRRLERLERVERLERLERLEHVSGLSDVTLLLFSDSPQAAEEPAGETREPADAPRAESAGPVRQPITDQSLFSHTL